MDDDDLVRLALTTGANAAIMEAHRLLAPQQPAAADMIMENWDLLLDQVRAGYDAVGVIQKARAA